MKKKIRSLGIFVLCAVLFCALCTVGAVAADETQPIYGTETLPEGEYHYKVVDGEATITNAFYVKGKITVPDTLGGYPVTEIDEHAFQYQSGITSITIPGSIKTIDEYAFRECYNMEEVVLEEGVEEILTGAFFTEGDDSGPRIPAKLKKVSFPKSLKVIEEHAFYATRLSGRFVLSENLVRLEPNAFLDTDIDEFYISENLKFSEDISLYGNKDKIKITIDKNNTSYAIDEKGNVFGNDKTALVKYTNQQGESEYTVPEGVTFIGVYCFAYQKELKNVVLPESLTHIGNHAFRDSGIEEIILPDSVYEIGEGVFYNCENLHTARLSESITKIPENCFEYDVALQQVNIPSGVTEIGWYAFARCENLKNVEIPDGITKIPEMAFYNCPLEGEIVFSENLKVIGDLAFRNSNLTKVTFLSDDITVGEVVFGYCDLKEVVFGDGNIVLDDWAFVGNEELKKISFNGGVVSLGKAVFEDSGIETMEINCDFGEIAENFYNERELYAAEARQNLKTLIIGKDVKDMDKLLYLPATLEEIIVDEENPYYRAKNGALYNKDITVLLRAFPSAKEYTIPSSVKEIGTMAFQGLDISYDLVIPEGIEVIGERAFYKADVERLDIPASVKKLGDRAFAWSELKTIVIYGKDIEYIDDNMFRGCKQFEDFYYAGTKAEYKAVSVSNKGNRLWGIDKHFEATPENHPHTMELTKATFSKDGLRYYFCPCGEKKKFTIPAVKTTTVTVENGKVVCKVKAGSSYLEQGKDYTAAVSYDSKKNIISVKFKLKGDYTGSKTVKIEGVLSPITFKEAATTTSSVTLKWPSIASATGYKLYKYNSSNKKWELLKKFTTNLTTEYTDKNLTAGKSYKYKIEAFSKVKELGVTLWSSKDDSISVKIPTKALKAPENLRIEKIDFYHATLSWDAVDGATGYTVFFKEIPTGSYKKVASCKAGETQVKLSFDFEASYTLQYKVRAYNKDGKVIQRSGSSVNPAVIELEEYLNM